MKNTVDIPLPPDEFMRLVGGASSENIEKTFETSGKSVADLMRRNGMLTEGKSLLDIGCGCGRTARQIIQDPLEMYEGFDRHKGMIDWCAESITPNAKNFHFTFVPVSSAYDHKDGEIGTIAPSSVRFPYDDQTFDSVLLASVFTHMTLEECRYYLSEILRVVKPHAKVLATILLAEGEERDDGINFYFKRENFENLVESANFTHELLGKPNASPHKVYLLRPATK